MFELRQSDYVVCMLHGNLRGPESIRHPEALCFSGGIVGVPIPFEHGQGRIVLVLWQPEVVPHVTDTDVLCHQRCADCCTCKGFA